MQDMKRDNLQTVEKMAEKLRSEPYSLFRNDCITKLEIVLNHLLAILIKNCYNGIVLL